MKGHNWGLCKKCGKEHSHPRGNLGKKFTDKHRLHISETEKRQYVSGEKAPARGMLGKHQSKESREKISRSITNKFQQDQEYKNKIKRSASRARTEQWKDPIYRDNMSKVLKQSWQDEKIKERRVKAILKSLHSRPNKPEQRLVNIVNAFNLPYKYTGNGEVIIEGLNPDLIDIDGSKEIIEVFGDYWHNRSDVKEKDKKRLEIYAKYGFRTLIIWESELNKLSEEEIVKKILDFKKIGDIDG